MRAAYQLPALLFCFAASAFFSGIETGAISVSHARLMHRVRSGSKAARLLNRYVSDLPRFLATTLVGNNLMNVMLSTLSAGLSQSCFPGHRLFQAAWGAAMACLVLVFAEYLPKLFFRTRPLRRTLRVVQAFQVVERVLSPVTALVLFLTRWLVPGGAATGRSFLMTREFIQNVVSDPKEGSQITTFERLMINRVLELQARTAAQVMTPLNRVTRTTEMTPLSACYQQVRDSGHVRLPVFSEDGARCVGVLNTLEVLSQYPVATDVPVGMFMQDAFFVPASVSAGDLLPLMRLKRQPMVLVGDGEADGGALGIITEENILAALTGGLT